MCLTMLSIKVDLPPFSSTKPSLRRFFDRSLLAAIHKGCSSHSKVEGNTILSTSEYISSQHHR